MPQRQQQQLPLDLKYYLVHVFLFLFPWLHQHSSDLFRIRFEAVSQHKKIGIGCLCDQSASPCAVLLASVLHLTQYDH